RNVICFITRSSDMDLLAIDTIGETMRPWSTMVVVPMMFLNAGRVVFESRSRIRNLRGSKRQASHREQKSNNRDFHVDRRQQVRGGRRLSRRRGRFRRSQ